ncbi:MAG TPA: hypothetical protein VFT69_08185 [Pseudolabrys sp.]|nr:hypothetical protein [Pseudolabrys sp.]
MRSAYFQSFGIPPADYEVEARLDTRGALRLCFIRNGALASLDETDARLLELTLRPIDGAKATLSLFPFSPKMLRPHHSMRGLEKYDIAKRGLPALGRGHGVAAECRSAR